MSESNSGLALFYFGQEKSYPFLATWKHRTTETTKVWFGLLIKVGDYNYLFVYCTLGYLELHQLFQSY